MKLMKKKKYLFKSREQDEGFRIVAAPQICRKIKPNLPNSDTQISSRFLRSLLCLVSNSSSDFRLSVRITAMCTISSLNHSYAWGPSNSNLLFFYFFTLLSFSTGYCMHFPFFFFFWVFFLSLQNGRKWEILGLLTGFCCRMEKYNVHNLTVTR